MTFGALVVFFSGLGICAVAGLAIAPGGIQVVWMRGIQLCGVNLVVAYNALQFLVFYVYIVRQNHTPDR